MTAPAASISVTDRYILKDLKLEQSGAVTPGRIMWCRDRKILGYGDVGDLVDIFQIPNGANTLCLSTADYADVKGWLG